jgi:hypothetical protein|tara:strand:- start:5401 stop:5769 length:369 start_codon:yes stop_codon:yes gene_type:complete
MEGITTYRYSEERKKWNDIKKRKKVFDENNYTCEGCFEKKKYQDLVIEHDYPCVLGGKNVKILCKKCHNPKTTFDINMITLFKKMEFICLDSYETTFFIPENELKDLYYTLRRCKFKLKQDY